MTECVGHCKDNQPCNHINGTCDNGCLDGWIGVNCSKRKKFKNVFVKANTMKRLNNDEYVCYVGFCGATYLFFNLTWI